MTEKPILFNTEMVRAILDGRKTQTRRIVKNQSLTEEYLKICGKPFYPGDVLWVRETWTVWSSVFGTMPAFHYKAACEYLKNVKWRPSIHMPKEAARIWLLVTDVRPERLKSISATDAMEEGFTDRNDFVRVWNSTIKKSDLRTYGWDANPWVWVISFKKIERDQLLRYADNDVAQGGLAPAT